MFAAMAVAAPIVTTAAADSNTLNKLHKSAAGEAGIWFMDRDSVAIFA
jgi:hypothetical protein